MKAFIKVSLLGILIITLTLILPSFMDNTNHTQAADEADWSEEGSSHFEGYTVLEIMPYKGMGEIGYLVGGQEPVDAELFTYNSGPGSFSHVQGALRFFRAYRQKDVPANGQLDTGWIPAQTDVLVNGYYENVGLGGGDKYSVNTGQTIYQRVAEGTGTHRAILPSNARLERVYQGGWNVFMRQNVNAYFTDIGDSSQLFNPSATYSPYCVEASADQTGDYDYDAERDRFILDIGNGSYDIIFEQDNQGRYYMLNNYEIVEDNSGIYSYQNIQYIPQAGGNYIINNNATTFTYQQNFGGTHRWVEDNTALSKPNFSREIVNGIERIWVQGAKVRKTFQFYYMLGIVNNELYKRQTLGVPSELANNFPVRVITLTPAQLNANLNDEQSLIDDADLIYINAREHDYLYIQLYEQYSYEGLALPSNVKYDGNWTKKTNELNFAYNDINWTVADKLFRKIAGIGCKKAGVIVDSSFYFDAINGTGTYSNYRRDNSGIGVSYSPGGATSINMAKLFIMIFQRNKIDFYNSFMNTSTSPVANRITPQTVPTNVSPTGSTATFIRPQASYGVNHNYARYWNFNTFLPWGLNADGQMVQFPSASFRDMGIYHTSIANYLSYRVDNVLVLVGDVGRILGTRFNEGFQIVNQDGSTSTITIDDLTEIVTGGGSGYEDTGGVSYPPGGDVEGPPDKPDIPDTPEDPGDIPDDGSSGSNIRKYKRVLNIQPTAYFERSETAIREMLSEYDLQIINMTSTQFNGSLDDINSIYDMIFMGSAIHNEINYGRFNITSNNRTNFNDTNLRRNFYLSIGDWIGLTNGAQVRYRSNDITVQKKNELISYLEAGYPIVLDSYLYSLTAQVGRIMDTTNMYSFVTTSKLKSNYRLLNQSDSSTSTFKNSITEGLAITKPRITLKSPISPDGEPVQTEELNIHFQLYPWEDMIHYYKYNAYFYVDRNADGIFDESDKLNITSSDGTNWEGIMLSLNTRKFKYNVADLNGVYQWKLLVERADNSHIRAFITGYVSNTNKETLNILHIRDNSSTYDLRQKSQDDTDSLIYLLAGEGKLDQYSLRFDSITVDKYEEQFTAAYPYNPSEPVTTGKLSKYHLLILDNPNDAIDNTYGAVSNIKDEIERNLGVIYTKEALGYERQKGYYSEDRYSFINHSTQLPDYTYTYNYINRNSASGLMIYRNMIGENGTNLRSDAAYRTNYLTKTNDGSITRYPYRIDKAIEIADNFYSTDAVIDYDHSISPKQSLVGWYCLSDTKSPLIREKFSLDGTADTLYRGVYSSSPNDVKNNYYLFSNKTTFYSGINLASVDQAKKVDEMKLFINTIYAARKATESRTIIAAPVVEITIPIEDSVSIGSDDLIDNHFLVAFKLTESVSNMSLDIQFGVDGLSYPWMNTIYEYNYGTLGAPIDISSGKVFESDKTYAILVHKDSLSQTPQLLRITASNEMDISGTDAVSIAFDQPPTVTIIEPISESSATMKYIYLDIDSNDLLDDADYLDHEGNIEIIFSVNEALSDVLLRVESDGSELAAGDYSICAYDGTDNRDSLDLSLYHPGDPETKYILQLKKSLMTNRNIREFEIIAKDVYEQEGSDSFTLLRRSLFPLD